MKTNSTNRKLGMQQPWTSTQNRLKNGEEKLKFGWGKTTCAGTFQIEAKGEDATFPYGFLWYQHETGNVIAIAWSFVLEPVRRCGIRTAIHKQLLEWFPDTRMIVTGRASNDSLPWLKKMGFVFNKDFDRWELAITPPKKKK